MPYSQRDTKWSKEKLGLSGAAATSTIGLYGCKVTALAEGLLRFDYSYTPSTMNAFLRDNGLYTGSTKNLIDDANITKAGFITSFKRVDNWNGNLEELTELLKTSVVIGEVSPVPIGGAVGSQHFVGIDSVDGKNVVITDPWFGDKIKVALRYNKYNNILGLRIYSVKKAVSSTTEDMTKELQACLTDRKKFWEERDAALTKLEAEKVRSKQLETERESAQQRAKDYEKRYEDFVLWVVDMLKPSGFLPPLTDEQYAKQLVKDLITEADTIRSEYQTKRKEWDEERAELLAEQKSLEKRLKELQEKFDEAQKELVELKEDFADHKEDTAEVIKQKPLLDAIKEYIDHLFNKRK